MLVTVRLHHITTDVFLFKKNWHKKVKQVEEGEEQKEIEGAVAAEVEVVVVVEVEAVVVEIVKEVVVVEVEVVIVIFVRKEV